MSKTDQKVSRRPTIHRTVAEEDADQFDNRLEEDGIEDELNDNEDNRRTHSGGEDSPDKYQRKYVKRANISPYSRVNQELDQMKRNDPTFQRKNKELPKIDKKEKKGSNDGINWSFWIIVTIITSIVSFLLFDGKRFFEKTESFGSVNSRTEWQTFQSEFESFERKYSEVIPVIGFKILNKSVGKVMNRNEWSQPLLSRSPAILLLIASEDNQNVLKCVKRDFVNTINKAYNENNAIAINGRQTDATDIVDKFDLNFRDQQKHIIIIENIESIEPKDVMSLHQFTDHENAKYKDVVIVMTAINYRKFNLTKSAFPREMDAIASQLFTIKWKNSLQEEQSFALISRLTPSVVTIIGQTKETFSC